MNKQQVEMQIATQTESIAGAREQLRSGQFSAVRRKELEIEVLNLGQLRYVAIHALQETDE
jgi:hypothetical protein